VIRWRSEFGLTVVDVSVNGHALKSSNYGLGEETDEKSSGNQRGNGNNYRWSCEVLEVVIALGAIFAHQEEGKAVEGHYKQVSDKHEHTGKGFSEVELNAVLQIDNEAVPSAGAKRVTADSHVRVGDEVDVVDGVFETLEAAHNAFTGGVGCAVSS
jgi:hypothetical protein